jgi:hypothetical protein
MQGLALHSSGASDGFHMKKKRAGKTSPLPIIAAN